MGSTAIAAPISGGLAGGSETFDLSLALDYDYEVSPEAAGGGLLALQLWDSDEIPTEHAGEEQLTALFLNSDEIPTIHVDEALPVAQSFERGQIPTETANESASIARVWDSDVVPTEHVNEELSARIWNSNRIPIESAIDTAISAQMIDQTQMLTESPYSQRAETPVLDNGGLGISAFSNTVTIRYVSTGHTSGTVPAAQTFSTPASRALQTQGSLARSGHTFGGWRDTAGNVFGAGQVVNWAAGASGTATLTAVWNPTATPRITIQYASFGHTSGSIPGSHTVNTPGSATMRTHNLVRPGFTFRGWQSSSSGNIFQPNQSVNFTGSGTITFTAVWEQSRITIQYASIGHTSGSVPQSHFVNTPGSEWLRTHNLVRPGFTFRGWQSSSSGNIFQPGQSVNFTGGGTITFTAVWEASRVTIQYASTGHTSGSIPGSHFVNTPGSEWLRTHNLVRPGFTFRGWQSSSSGNIFQPGQSVNFTGSGTITFTAVWEASRVTIQYASTGHTGGSIPGSHFVNTPGVGRLVTPTLTRTGHTFAGWRSSSSGNVFQPGRDINFTGGGTITYTAVWEPVAVTRVTIQYASIGHTSGSVPASHTVNTPGQERLRDHNLVRTGHTFRGWQVSTTGDIFQPGQLMNFTGSGTLTFTAVWEASTQTRVTIQYASTGHTSGSVPASHTVNTPGQERLREHNLVRTGHTFRGWQSSTSSGGIFQPGQLMNFTGSGTITYTAVWESSGSSTLTLEPATDWNNIPAIGGTRTVTVTPTQPAYTVRRPTWMNPTTFLTDGRRGFVLSAPANNTGAARTGTVTVIMGDWERSFAVTQLATGSSTLSTPQNFRITGQASGSVTVAWNPVAGATGYRVHFGAAPRSLALSTPLDEFAHDELEHITYEEWREGRAIDNSMDFAFQESRESLVRGEQVSLSEADLAIFNATSSSVVVTGTTANLTLPSATPNILFVEAINTSTGAVSLPSGQIRHTFYRVRYDRNLATHGNPPVDTMHYVSGDWATVLPTPAGFLRNGVPPEGWSTTRDAGPILRPGDRFRFTADRDVTLYARWRDPYAALNLHFPMDSFTSLGVRRFDVPEGHQGIDLLAPEGIPIRAIDGGEVIASGGVIVSGVERPHDSMGWFVVITHNARRPGTNNRLTARYLHLQNRPPVSTGDTNIVGNQIIGHNGNTGQSTSPHLHIDINTVGGIWGSGVPANQAANVANSIDPVRFWPDRLAPWLGNNAAIIGMSYDYDPFDTAMTPDNYIDGRIVDLIGMDALEQWLITTPRGEANITTLIHDFEITREQLQNVVEQGNLQWIYNVSQIMMNVEMHRSFVSMEQEHQLENEERIMHEDQVSEQDQLLQEE